MKIIRVKAEPRTWTVDDDGPADFHMIQDAINCANHGDIIHVASGIYYENMIVNKEITILGEDRSSTIIDGIGKDVITVTANNVGLHNFSIVNSEGYINDPHNGILLDHCQSTIVTNNRLWNNFRAIHLYHSNNTVVSDNSIDNPFYTGIEQSGIQLDSSHLNTLANNKISDCGAGILLSESSDNIIVGNTLDPNVNWGAWLESSSNNIISRNHMSHIPFTGIRLTRSSDNTISTNTIVNFGNWGIELYLYCYDNSIAKNYVSHGGIGLMLITFNSANIISENTISSNYLYGIQIECYGNFIRHNNFIDNSRQVFIEGVNVWDDDYPSGGNYWSDYVGMDQCNGPNQEIQGSDGIGDTPYIMGADNIDHYPLMNPWTPTETSVRVQGKDYPVTIVSNTTLDQIVSTPNTLHFKSSGPTGDKGYINVIFPMVNTTDKVFIDGQKLTPPPFPVINSNGTHYSIYFEFTLSTHDIELLFAPLAPSVPVGGEWVPVNKFELLAPWIGSVSLMMMLAASFVCVKHKKKQANWSPIHLESVKLD